MSWEVRVLIHFHWAKSRYWPWLLKTVRGDRCVLAFWKILPRASLFCVSWTILCVTPTSWFCCHMPYYWLWSYCLFHYKHIHGFIWLSCSIQNPYLKTFNTVTLIKFILPIVIMLIGFREKGVYKFERLLFNLSYPLPLIWEHIIWLSTLQSLMQTTTKNSSRVPLPSVPLKMKSCFVLLNYLFKQQPFIWFSL